MNGNGNGGMRSRLVYVACGVSLAFSVTSMIGWFLGESPLTAQRRTAAVADLKREMATMNASLIDLRAAVEAIGGRR